VAERSARYKILRFFPLTGNWGKKCIWKFHLKSQSEVNYPEPARDLNQYRYTEFKNETQSFIFISIQKP